MGDMTNLSNQAKHPGESPTGRVKVWRIGLRQLVAMPIGIIVYVVFRSFVVFGGIHGIIFTNNDFIIPALVIAVFFGVTFGPWVGLITGGVGTAISYPITPWDFINFSPMIRALSRRLLLLNESILVVAFGYALIGFIAGFALYARGRSSTLLSLMLVDIAGAIGIIFGLGLTFFLLNNDLSEAFTNLILPNVVVSLVLLPILFGIDIVVTGQVVSSYQHVAQRDHR